MKVPTAYFALNDIIALGAVRAMKEKVIKIPDQVSIVGFDDMPFCEIRGPRLTTMKVYTHDIGKTAVKRLAHKIFERDGRKLKIQIDAELIERGSVKKISRA